jgi:chaperonin cofactor prefoldin
MEIVLKPLVRSKFINLLQQKKQIENSMNELISVVAECEGAELTANSIVEFSDNVDRIIIKEYSIEDIK